MFVNIAQIECLLTPHLAEEFKWGYYVNLPVGKGQKQEILNKISKNIKKIE